MQRKSVDRDRYERDLALQARVRESYQRQARGAGLGRARRRARRRTTIAADVVQRGRRHDSRCRKRPHLRDPRLLQHPRARLERRAGRAHIVDQHDDRAGERGGGARRRRRRRARCDGAGRPAGRSASRVARTRRSAGDDRQAEVPREIGGLIESALAAARRVQRHRHDAGGAGEHVGAALAHQRAERPRQRSPSVVLQRVDDRAQRAVVGADRARAIDQPRGVRRQRGQQASGMLTSAPGRQRIAAAIAERRRERQDRAPAARRRPDRGSGASSGSSQAAQAGARTTERSASEDVQTQTAAC